MKNGDVDKRNLQCRIKRFYDLLNARQWEECFSLIDPQLRDRGDVELKPYVNSLSGFFDTFGPLSSISVEELKLYEDVKNNKHDDRDFAYGIVLWEDREHQMHKLQERWVRAADGQWYSRMVGLV